MRGHREYNQSDKDFYPPVIQARAMAQANVSISHIFWYLRNFSLLIISQSKQASAIYHSESEVAMAIGTSVTANAKNIRHALSVSQSQNNNFLFWNLFFILQIILS